MKVYFLSHIWGALAWFHASELITALRDLVPHLFILYLRKTGHRETGTRHIFIIANTRWRSDSVRRLQLGLPSAWARVPPGQEAVKEETPCSFDQPHCPTR